MSRSEKEVYEQVGVAMTCRSYDEYADMFALDELMLSKGPVLDVAAGASSFTAALRSRGINGFAADPMYARTPEQLGEAGMKEIGVSLAKLEKLIHLYNWEYYGSMENQRKVRERSLELFLEDYTIHRDRGAYVAATLPHLPFADETFPLVVCSHFLFLYGRQFDEEFHRQALSEMIRVCAAGGQVRIYPLVDLHWNEFEELQDLLHQLRNQGHTAELLPTKLDFIPKSTHLLSIRKSAES